MKPKRWRALKPGMSRSTAFAAASRRSLERGSAATAFGACDGGGWQRPVCRSASPQSSTTSSAVPGFSPRPDDTAKGSGRSSNIAAYFSGPPIAGKADRITENDDPRTGPTNAFSRPIECKRYEKTTAPGGEAVGAGVEAYRHPELAQGLDLCGNVAPVVSGEWRRSRGCAWPGAAPAGRRHRRNELGSAAAERVRSYPGRRATTRREAEAS